MPDLQPLYQRAAMIRDAVLKWENTANRVGSLFYDILSQIQTIDTGLSDKYLRKDIPDSAKEKITFEKGLQIGPAFAPGLTGTGGNIDPYGNAEFDSLTLRKFLNVPDIQYNRIKIVVGDAWRAPGGGIIDSVDTVNKIITLKLEEGEYGEVSVGDKCMGIYHSFASEENEVNSLDDSRGNRTFAGFATSYFEVVEILETETNSQFRYELRPVSERWSKQIDPYEMMHFVAYANPDDITRQTARYSTRTYERYLCNMTDWEIGADNIAAQFGDLTNMTIHGFEMADYSAYLSNIYMTGTIQQFDLIKPMDIMYSSISDPGNPTDNPGNWVDTPNSGTIWMAIRVIKNGKPGAWDIVRTRGENGNPGGSGQAIFKSTVFIRTNTTPGTPSGGSFSSPIPTTSGWTDGVPSGSAKLWMSTRIFTSDGLTPQQTAWMAPTALTDNSSVEFMFSSVATPGNPTSNPSNWTSTGDSSSIWMATRSISNGVAGAWTVTKIKGESGSDALTMVISPENIIVSCDSDGNPKTGELGATGKTLFTVDVYRGATKLTFGSEWQFYNTAYTNIVIGQISGTSTLFLSGITANAGFGDFTVRIGSIYLTKRLNAKKAYDGSAGDSGQDGITLLLTNVSHAIACDSFGTALPGELGSTGKAITTVNVYRGSTKLAFGTDWTFDGGQTSSTSGLSYSQIANQPTLYVNSMVGDSGHITIAVKIGSIVLLPKWIITKQKDGRSDIAYRKALWVTGKQYYKGLSSEPYLDFVKYENLWYMCKASHISGTFTTDLNAGRWAIMNNFENVATDLVLSRKILAEEIDTDNIVAKNMRTANSGARVEAFGSEQNFYNENGVKQMQIGIVNGNVVLTYFAADGSKLYDLGPGGFNWGAIKPASWSEYKQKSLNQTATPTMYNVTSKVSNWNYKEGPIAGETFFSYYAGVNPTITEADRQKEKYIYMYQNLSGGYIPNGWYLNPAMPRFTSGSYASQWNADPKVLSNQLLNNKSSIAYRQLLNFVGGLIVDEMKVAWNDGESIIV